MDDFSHHIKQFCWEYSSNKYLKAAHQTQIPAFLLFNLQNVSPILLHQLIGLLKSTCNYGHNFLSLFDALPNFLFMTSETKRDY